MLLYKFRPLNPFEHLADILVNQRLHASFYEDLNDPFEGQYIQAFGPHYKSPLRAGMPICEWIETPGAVDLKAYRICSLSSQPDDVRMWSLYADSHRGVAVECEFPDELQGLYRVNYVDRLMRISGAGTLLTGPPPDHVDVLCQKTREWSFESEVRIISRPDCEWINVRGMLRRILVGLRTPSGIVELLQRIAPPDVTLARAALDYSAKAIHFEPLSAT